MNKVHSKKLNKPIEEIDFLQTYSLTYWLSAIAAIGTLILFFVVPLFDFTQDGTTIGEVVTPFAAVLYMLGIRGDIATSLSVKLGNFGALKAMLSIEGILSLVIFVCALILLLTAYRMRQKVTLKRVSMIRLATLVSLVASLLLLIVYFITALMAGGTEAFQSESSDFAVSTGCYWFLILSLVLALLLSYFFVKSYWLRPVISLTVFRDNKPALRFVSVLLAVIVVLSTGVTVGTTIVRGVQESAEAAQSGESALFYYQINGGEVTITGAKTREANLTIPAEIGGAKVTRIGAGAFAGSTYIKSVTFPNTLRTIGESAFYGCNSIESLEIPASVSNIGKSAFEGCSSLKTVMMRCIMTSLAANLFADCTSLESILLPTGVKEIRVRAFKNCDSLTNIYYNGNSSGWKNIDIRGDRLYNKNFTETQHYYFSANEPTDTSKSVQYWHYDENNMPVVW